MTSFQDLRHLAAGEVKSQLATGVLTIWPRERSASLPGVGFGGQPAGPSLAVRAVRQPMSSFDLAAGGGEVNVLSRRFGVLAEDLVLEGRRVHVGPGTQVEYREDDRVVGGVTVAGEVLRGVVEDTSDAMGGQRVMMMVQMDRGSSERGGA